MPQLRCMCVLVCIRMEQNYVWSRIATLFAMETYSSYVAAASVACDVWMPQLRLRAATSVACFFCVSLMTPRVASGRVVRTASVLAVRFEFV